MRWLVGRKRNGERSSRIEKEKCKSLADVALAAANITRIRNDALVTLG